MKKTTVYLPDNLHLLLMELAKIEKRSFNSEIVYALELFVREKVQPPKEEKK